MHPVLALLASLLAFLESLAPEVQTRCTDSAWASFNQQLQALRDAVASFEAEHLFSPAEPSTSPKDMLLADLPRLVDTLMGVVESREKRDELMLATVARIAQSLDTLAAAKPA